MHLDYVGSSLLSLSTEPEHANCLQTGGQFYSSTTLIALDIRRYIIFLSSIALCMSLISPGFSTFSFCKKPVNKYKAASTLALSIPTFQSAGAGYGEIRRQLLTPKYTKSISH